MFGIRPALAGALLLVTSAAAAGEPPYYHLHLSRVQALRDRIQREVVVVEARRRAPTWPHHELRFDGGGIHVGEGRILTCAFFLEGAERIRVRLPGGRRVGARLLRRSLPLGLALLDVPEARDLPVPRLAPPRRTKTTGVVYLLQNPATSQGQVHLGQMAPAPPGAFYAQASFVARNGHPLYDEWGRVAGIAALPSKRALTAMVIPAWAARRFLSGKKAESGTNLRIRRVKTRIGRASVPR